MRWKLHLALLPSVVALWLPGTAGADQNWKTNSAAWKIMDACTMQARKAYPDYTRESNAKREKARQECLRVNNLPTEDTSVPSPPAQQK